MRYIEAIENFIGTFKSANSVSRISIQNSVFINNHFTNVIYKIFEKSTLRTDNSSFRQNNMIFLLFMISNSGAIIQNGTLTENNVAWYVYAVYTMSSIQLNDVAFTRNNFEERFLVMALNSSVIIQNNKRTENTVAR